VSNEQNLLEKEVKKCKMQKELRKGTNIPFLQQYDQTNQVQRRKEKKSTGKLRIRPLVQQTPPKIATKS
jgi:hypothetical protein